MYWFKFMAVALVAGLVFPAADALLVTGPTEVAGQSILSPVACNYNFYALNGWVLDPETLSAETLSNMSTRFDGAIVLMSTIRVNYDRSGTPRSLPWDIFRFLDHGAVAVGMVNTAASVSGFQSGLMPIPDLCEKLRQRSSLLFDINYVEGNKLLATLASYPNMTIHLNTTDPNPWNTIRRTWEKPWRICFSFATGFISALALSKLIGFVRCHGFEISIPQVTLSILFLVTLFRTIYHAIDPVFFGSTFTLIECLATLTVTFPFELLLEILTSKAKVKPFLGRSRWLFIAVAIITFIFELLQSVLRTYLDSIKILIMINVLCYVLFGLVLTAFYIYTGARLLKHIRKSDLIRQGAARKKSKRTLTRMALLIALAATFNFGWFASLVMAAAAVTETPGGFYATFLIGWISLTAVSFVQVLAFQMPKRTQTSGSLTTPPTSPSISSPRL